MEWPKSWSGVHLPRSKKLAAIAKHLQDMATEHKQLYNGKGAVENRGDSPCNFGSLFVKGVLFLQL